VALAPAVHGAVGGANRGERPPRERRGPVAYLRNFWADHSAAPAVLAGAPSGPIGHAAGMQPMARAASASGAEAAAAMPLQGVRFPPGYVPGSDIVAGSGDAGPSLAAGPLMPPPPLVPPLLLPPVGAAGKRPAPAGGSGGAAGKRRAGTTVDAGAGVKSAEMMGPGTWPEPAPRLPLAQLPPIASNRPPAPPQAPSDAAVIYVNAATDIMII